MPTFKTLLETANGLYCESADGAGYSPGELMGALPETVLSQPVVLERLDPLTYTVRLWDGEDRAYVLYSRRRLARR